MFRFMCIASLLQVAVARSLNESTYLVTVTSQTVSGSTETLCAHLHQPREPLLFNITLEMEGGSNTVLLEEEVTEDFYRCVQFQVPPVLSDTTVKISAAVKGPTETLKKETMMLINPITFPVIVQTDKPVYKPGQTILFRIVSLDRTFLPYDQVFHTVELQDPNSNRIAQWLNRTAVSGILDFSHPTTLEATQGRYLIRAWSEHGKETSHSFSIKEYVLPKYEVKVHLPEILTILDTQATLKVCGKYTYGKPVLGLVKADVCLKHFRYFWHRPVQPPICVRYTMDADRTGCATEMMNLTAFALKSAHSLHVESEIEEHGTGVILKGSGSVHITADIFRVSFADTPPVYRPGIAYEGKVLVKGADSSPVPNKTVYLLVTYQDKSSNLTLTTDSKGVAHFSLDTSPWMASAVSLKADLKPDVGRKPFRRPSHYDLQERYHEFAWHSMKPFFSVSKSFLKIRQVDGPLPCDKDGLVRAQFIIQGGDLESIYCFYLVLSRGSIVEHGRLQLAVKEGEENKGEVSFALKGMSDLAPYAQVLVYMVLPGGEVVADSYDVPIQKCLKNKVSLQFSSHQELPGEKTSLVLNAHPGSLCSLRAIDQSVLLMEPERELTVDSVYSQLPIQRLSGYFSADELYPCISRGPLGLVSETGSSAVRSQKKRSSYFGFGSDNDDTFSVFKGIGVKILTNSKVRKPVYCYNYVNSNGFATLEDGGLMAPRFKAERGFGGLAPEPVKETIRTYFPETWVWELVPVGDSGSVKVEQTVPDTITKWVADAFCTSSVGLGLAPKVSLTAFQPFFVSLTLPYSVIRGEVFTLKASVFNYLPKCIMVQVSLPESDQFTARPCEGCKYSLCLCDEESKTFSWILTPTSLGEVTIKVRAEALKTDDLCGNEVVTVPERGRIDTVIRTLLVEAEGTEQTISHNALLCPAEGAVEKSISLELPEVYVEGSTKASLTVLGDLMGRAMKNLDSLLAMPYGCGEQNMILFAPNIYILKYLDSTGQLTQEIKTRATRFLEGGYQRELNYKHDDGSYSAFGKSDPSGNTWLTAFVMKSFGGARPYIFIDSKHIAQAKAWLSSHQESSGCFRSVGKLFHNGMKGGVSDEVSLTAYITAALLELDGNTTDPIVNKGLSCLKAASDQLDNIYTTALLSYTFTLAGDHEMRTKLVTYLAKQAKITGGACHWERLDASKKKTDSLEVEMTSYVLLALLSGPPLPEFGLGFASSIVRWLTQQQNPYGGFSSTQDTVVALKALALYGAVTFSPEGVSTVTVASDGGYKHEFTIDQHNRLLYQEEYLKEVPGNYRIKAEGKSCAFLQIALRYNIPPPPDFSVFNITANAEGLCNDTENNKKSLKVSVVVRYDGRREETNMVIVSVKLLSGYVPDKESLGSLKGDSAVKRVDEEEGHIIIYLEGLKKLESKTLSVTITEDVRVRNLKPAVVKVYDYYQTSDEAVAEYASLCSNGDELNEL